MTDERQSRMDLWAELRGHPAFQAAVVFAGASWLALQAADIFGLSTGVVRAVGLVLMLVLVGLSATALFAVLRGAARSGARPADADAGKGAVAAERRVATSSATSSDAATSQPRVRGFRARTAFAAAGVLLLLGAGAWVARPFLVPPVRPGSEVIAVLPFQASGAGVELLGEGMVDLLSTNLDQVGQIRTINPRTVLHRYGQRADGGSIDLEGALSLGGDVDAGSVLLGSVVSTGSEVRLTARLYAVETGSLIAEAQHTGPIGDVLTLADELSVELLRAIWRSNEPLPDMNVAAITTPSPQAISAYLRGEQHYRRLAWDSAKAAFERALSYDSTFALAHLRLGETYGWTESLGSAQAQAHAGAAVRFADRLPVRERAFAIAHQLMEQGETEAIDSLESYTARYPDDVAGRFLLADAMFHAAPLLDLDPQRMLEQFAAVHEMNPDYAPNYTHLLELTMIARDTAAFNRYLAGLRTRSPREAEQFASLGTVRFGARDDALAAAGELMSGPFELPVVTRLATTSLQRALMPPVDIDFALAVADTIEHRHGGMPQTRANALQGRAVIYTSAGQFRDAEALLASLREIDAQMAMGVAMPGILTGLAPDDVFQPERAMLRTARTPLTPVFRAVGALLRNDDAAAGREIAAARRDTTGALPAAVIDGLEAWRDVVRGDTVGGVARLREAIDDLGFMDLSLSAPFTHQLALLLVLNPETRPEGIRRLRWLTNSQDGLLLLLLAPLAEAYVAEGRVDEARATYAWLLQLLENADPELEPLAQSTRAALARLSGERAP